jgi:hypothetical protein
MRQETVSTARRSSNRKLAPLTNLTSNTHAEDSTRSVIGLQHGLDELAERTLCMVRKLVDILVQSSNAPREPNFANPARLAATVTRNRVPKLAQASYRGYPVYTCVCWFQQAHHHGLTSPSGQMVPLVQSTVARTRAVTILTDRIENMVTQRQTLFPARTLHPYHDLYYAPSVLARSEVIALETTLMS